MSYLCGRVCENKTEYGYCKTTYCIYPNFSHIAERFVTLPLDKPPSHFCAVCGKLERDNAITCTSAFWLCNKCLGKLKKLMEEVKDV